MRVDPVDKAAVPLWYHEGKLVLDTDNHPVRKFDIIPAVCSSQMEGWLMVAIMHTDTRVRTGDMRARMPKEVEIKGRGGQGNHRVVVASPNALSMRATRFRNKAGLLPREQRGGSINIEEYIKKFYPQEYLDANNSKGYRDLTDEEVLEMKEANFGQYGHKARMHNRVAKRQSTNESSALFPLKIEPNLTRSAPTPSTLRRSGRRMSTRAQVSRTMPTRKQPPRASKRAFKAESSSPSSIAETITFDDDIELESMDGQEVSHDTSMLDEDDFQLNDGENQSWDTFSYLPNPNRSQMELGEETMKTSQVDHGFLPVNQTQDHAWVSAAPRIDEDNDNHSNTYPLENAGSPYEASAMALSTDDHRRNCSFTKPFFGSTSHRGADDEGLVNHQHSDFTLPLSVLSPMTDEFPAIHSDPHPLASYFDPSTALYDIPHHADTNSFSVDPRWPAPAPIFGSSTATHKSRGRLDTNSFNVEPHPLASAPALGPSARRHDRRGRTDNQSFNVEICPLAPAPTFGSSTARYDSRGRTDIHSVNDGPRPLAPAPIFGQSIARHSSLHRPQGHDSDYRSRLLENAASSDQASMNENLRLDNGGNNTFAPQAFSDTLGSYGVSTYGCQAFHTGDTNSAANRSLGTNRSSRPLAPEEHRPIPRGSRLGRQGFENELSSRGFGMSGYQRYNTSQTEGLAIYQPVTIDTGYTNQTRSTSTLAPYVSRHVQGNPLRKRHEEDDGGVPTGVMKPHDGTSGEIPKMGNNDHKVDLMQYEDTQWGHSQNPQASMTRGTVQGQAAGYAIGSMQGVHGNNTNPFDCSADVLRQYILGRTEDEDLSPFVDFDGLASMDEYEEGSLFDPGF